MTFLPFWCGYLFPGTPVRSWWWGGTSSQVWGVPHPRGYPGQVLMVGGTQGTPPPSRPSQGVPQVPPHHQTFRPSRPGPPSSRPGWGTPHPWDGVPPTPDLGWGTPTIQTWMGYPQPQTWNGEPPHPRPEMGYPLPPPIQTWTEYPPRPGTG